MFDTTETVFEKSGARKKICFLKMIIIVLDYVLSNKLI
jgi:hypothetical protein